MLIISNHGNSAFRSEELEGVFRMKDNKTNRITKTIKLHFKSGSQVILQCKNLKETKELFNDIIEVMKQDYMV